MSVSGQVNTLRQGMYISLKNDILCACVIDVYVPFELDFNEVRALLGRRGIYPRVALTMARDVDILQNFWGLSSLDEKEREDSARELLTALSNKQVFIL